MSWTAQVPTQPGWYWWRPIEGSRDWYAGIENHPPPIVVHVGKRKEPCSWESEWYVDHPFMDYSDELNEWYGEWYGPLETPK